MYLRTYFPTVVLSDIHYLNSGDWVETLSALTEDKDGNWSIRYFDCVRAEVDMEKKETQKRPIAS